MGVRGSSYRWYKKDLCRMQWTREVTGNTAADRVGSRAAN